MGNSNSSYYNSASPLATALNPNCLAAMQADLDGLMSSGATGQHLDNITGGAIVLGGGEVTGGSILGGSNVLQDYGNSMYSKAKESLVRNIAEEVFKALDLHGARYAQTAKIGDVVNHLAKIVPNPSKGGKFNASFNKSRSDQKNVVDVMANAINKHYGSTMIDVDASPASKVQAVGEVVSSLLQGLQTEFMTVAGDVLRVMRNMQALNEYIDASYNKQKELVDASGDDGLKQQAAQVADFYNKLKAELARQTAMVSNMLNVSIGPTGKNLIGLLEQNRDFQGLVKDLKADIGTDHFGTKIAYMLSGVSSVAHSAAIIEKALKTLGMKASEFRNSKNTTELRLKIFDHIQKKHPSSRELDKLMSAAEVIYNHDYDHSAIAKKIKGGLETFGGYAGVSGVADADADVPDTADAGDGDAADAGVAGGDDSDEDLPAYWSKKSLSKKIKKKEKYRGMLLKDFNKLLKAHYRTIVNASDTVAKAIGTSIPVDDDLDRFIKVFADLPTMNKENLHVALSGYAKDVTSKSRRESFMNKYRLVNLSIEPLARGSGATAFGKMSSAIKDTIKAIDNFSNNIVDSLTEIHIDRPEEISAHVRGQARDFFGSADGNGELGSNSFVEFERVKMEMTYRFNIAHIKTNLARSAEEMTHFGKDYEAVLGEEAGYLINAIKTEYNTLIDQSNPATTCTLTHNTKSENDWENHVLLYYETAVAANADKSLNVAAGTSAYKADVKLWKKQRDAKVKMVEVAQAVDMYLRSFADGIARHPDSVGSVVKMLDQVELVAKWFDERSGDNLAALFESFPAAVGVGGSLKELYSTEDGAGILDKEGKLNKLPTIKDNHYYAWLEETNQLKLPGNPTLGRPVATDNGDKLVEGMLSLGTKAVKSMRALENILSAFESVGSKFGNINPQSATFMSPGQIFNSLCEYVVASSFTTGFCANSKDITGAVHAGGTQVKNFQENACPTKYQENTRPAVPDNELKLAGHLSSSASYALSEGKAPDRYFGGHGILSGVHNEGTSAEPMILLKKLSSVAMSSIPDTSEKTSVWDYHNPSNRATRLDRAGWNDRMFDTDHLFMMTIKSIVCKVFTVVDAYRLFNRPTIRPDTHDSLNPIRTILGGGIYTPKIVPEALELYMRLPLLAEWYREMFGFEDKRTTQGNTLIGKDDWILSIIPNVDGIWSDFIKLIFDQARYISAGNYSETQVQKIVDTVNKIYKSYKAKYNKATCRNIINSFVMEMNRIFGFMKQKEINKYFDNRRKYLNADQNDGADSKNSLFDASDSYDILNADDQFGRRQAPSDKFITVAEKTDRRNQRNAVHLQQKIVELRNRIDTDFNTYVKKNASNKANPVRFVSFKTTLNAYQQDVQNAHDATDKYKVVLNMIQGSTKLVNSSADKLIMVHESIAAPMVAVHNIARVIQNFNNMIHGLSFKNLLAWDAAQTQDPGTTPCKESYEKYLKEVVYKNASSKDCENIAGVMFGGNSIYGGGVNRSAGNSALSKVRWSDMFRDQLAAILDLAANSHQLVTVNVGTTGAINVDLSRLFDMVNSMINKVKQNINKMRLDFTTNPNIISKYENPAVAGSIPNIEENLIEKVFKNRDGFGLDVGLSEHLQSTLSLASNPKSITDGGVGVSMSDALASLVYYSSNNTAGAGAADTGSSYGSYAVNDTKTFPFNVFPTKIKFESMSPGQKKAIVELQTSGLAVLTNHTHANEIVEMPVISFAGCSVGNKPTELNQWKLSSARNSSLLLRFNQLVHKYLYDNMDTGTKKFYMPLIESFMNGPASREVIQNKAFANVFNMKGNALVDNAPYKPTVGQYMPPGPPNTVLFLSSVMIMKQFANTIDPLLKKKLHSYETVAEIPEYMKERMRGNLPYYSKLFAQAYHRADLLRRILSNTNIKNNVGEEHPGTDINNGGHPIPVSGGVQFSNHVEKNTEDHTEYMIGLLNRITQLTQGIKQCTDSVYKEMQDTNPYFMDVRKNFSKDFKQQHGVLPIMPASNVLLPQNSMNGVVANWEANNNTLLLPDSANGSDVYKFNYASRLLLARNDVEPQMNHMPGAIDVYDNYSRSASRNSMVSKADYNDTVLLMVKMARFLNDGASYGRLYRFDRVAEPNKYGAGGINTSSVYTGTMNYVDLMCIDATNTDLNSITAEKRLEKVKEKMMPYIFQQQGGSKTSLQNVLNMVENPNYEKTKEDLANVIDTNQHSTHTGTRADMRTANILDMNIVPVNVHAFMREVPFTNIVNYSYTFDRMVHEFILPTYMSDTQSESTISDLNIKPNSNVNNTRELMVKLLTHPYADLGTNGSIGNQYYSILGSLFNGNDNLKLGRPRYLSDQLWHKALLTSSVQIASGQPHHRLPGVTRNELAIEAGPQAYEAQRAVVQYGRPSNNDTYARRDDVNILLAKYLVADATIGAAYSGKTVVDVFNALGAMDDTQLSALEEGLPTNIYANGVGNAGAIPDQKGNTLDKLQHIAGEYRQKPDTDQKKAFVAYVNALSNNIGRRSVHQMSSVPVATAGLKYYDKAKNQWRVYDKANAMSPADVVYCAELGNVRFNTKLVRNLTWFVQLQRIMRVVLTDHLDWIASPVVKGLKIINPVITEYEANDQYNNDDFNGVKYSMF